MVPTWEVPLHLGAEVQMSSSELMGTTYGDNMDTMAEKGLSEVAQLLLVKTVVLILLPAPSPQPTCDKRVVSSEIPKGKVEELHWRHTVNVLELETLDSRPENHLQYGNCIFW